MPSLLILVASRLTDIVNHLLPGALQNLGLIPFDFVVPPFAVEEPHSTPAGEMALRQEIKRLRVGFSDNLSLRVNSDFSSILGRTRIQRQSPQTRD